MNGFLNILKPPGMTSAAVVGVVKRLIHGEKVGHAGTLDPEAAGVLPVMVGKAARLFDYLVDKEKSYIAQVAFGASTDTQDAQGRVLRRGSVLPSREEVERALPALTGRIAQTPPAFSAIKQNGRPLYDLARKGQAVAAPARQIRVDRIALTRQLSQDSYLMRVDCGRGTYVRTLCHDLGELTGCPAHMRFLLRIRSGIFSLEDARTLEEIQEAAALNSLGALLAPLDGPVAHLPRADVPKALAKVCRNGGKMPAARLEGLEGLPAGAPFRVYLEGDFYGICEIQGEQAVFRAMIAPE